MLWLLLHQYVSCVFVYDVVTFDINHKFMTAADLPSPKPFKSGVFDNKSQKTWRFLKYVLKKQNGKFSFLWKLWLQSPCLSLRFLFTIHVHKTVSSHFEFAFELTLSYQSYISQEWGLELDQGFPQN